MNIYSDGIYLIRNHCHSSIDILIRNSKRTFVDGCMIQRDEMMADYSALSWKYFRCLFVFSLHQHQCRTISSIQAARLRVMRYANTTHNAHNEGGPKNVLVEEKEKI